MHQKEVWCLMQQKGSLINWLQSFEENDMKYFVKNKIKTRRKCHKNDHPLFFYCMIAWQNGNVIFDRLLSLLICVDVIPHTCLT